MKNDLKTKNGIDNILRPVILSAEIYHIKIRSKNET